MIKYIIIIIIILMIFVPKSSNTEKEKKDKGFIDGGDEFNDEDYMMLEILEDDEE